MNVREFKEALDIFAKYMENGEETGAFICAEHDEIFIHVPLEDLPLDSEDGKRLEEIGFGADEYGECWSAYV